MGVEQEVSTVFTAKNEAAGPFSQLEAQAKSAADQVEHTTKSLDMLSKKTATLKPAAAVQQPAAAEHHEVSGPSYLKGLPEAERDRLVEAKQEVLLRRARLREMRLDMSGEHAAHQAAAAAMMLVGGETKGLIGQIMKTTGAVQMAGMTLGSFGGKAGKLGNSLLQMTGPIMFGAAALEVLHGASEKVAEALEKYREQTEASTEMQKLLGHGAEMFKGEQFKQAAMLAHTATEEDRYADALELAARRLPGLPIDRTSAEMEKFRAEAALTAANLAKRGKTDEETAKNIQAAYEKILQVAEKSPATMLMRMEAEEKLAKSLDGQLKLFKALPFGASEEEKKHRDAALQQQGESMQGLNAEQRAQAGKQLKEMSAAQDARENIVKQLEKEEADEARINALALASKTKSMLERKQAAKELAESMVPDAEHHGNEVAAKTREIYGKLTVPDMKKVNASTNFYNSKFDIKQNFAEGFDPDRIAVAFANDLQKLSVNGSSSSGTPMNAARHM